MAQRILLLSDVNSPHTRKLVHGLAGAGFVIGIFSLSRRQGDFYAQLPDVTIFDEAGVDSSTFHASSAGKLGYLKKVGTLKAVIRTFQPSIVHAHYATSYGLLGWRSGFHPFLISAWGSDVLDFPKGMFKRLLLKKILRSADALMATSPVLQRAIKNIAGRNSILTPFGVDTAVFFPKKVERPFPGDVIVFGTVKALEKVYGIPVLLDAFAALKKEMPAAEIRLLIVGDGTQREALAQQAKQLNIENNVLFTGKVDHAVVAEYHNMLDVLVNISEYESFGVTVLEAMACGKPVIVTDTGGLAEIVEENVDGLKVPVNNIIAVKEAMRKMLSEELRKRLGEKGREKVMRDYEWNRTVKLLQTEYERIGGKL